MTDGFSAASGEVMQERRRLRAHALAMREAMPAVTRATLTERIAGHLDRLLDHLSPVNLAFCWPYRAEPDMRAWAAGWLARGPDRRIALPVVLDSDAPLLFREWTPETPMQVDRHGIPFPASGAWIDPEVVLVPLNAFDSQGYRLGYGGGYFDRTLAARRVVAVGVGFEIGRVATVHPLAHDRAMDWIVTEAGCTRSTASGAERHGSPS